MSFNHPYTLRFRQVHLDFHTSGAIQDVGSRFDKKLFQEALRRGRVDSITVFSKCHHGWSYHPTNVGRIHPTLNRNLLGEQIEACREIGVRCPIYISAGLDEVISREHPEWLVKDKNGSAGLPLSAGYRRMRFNSPYLDYLCAQIEEVVNLWPDNDGIFLDIISPSLDYSWDALTEMRTRGLDPMVDSDVMSYAQSVLLHYYERTTASVKSVRKETPVFHNGGHIPIGADEFNFFNSHFELESLPTGGWGYDHFPLSARYAITKPRDFLGMTGKFHNTWGEFGGFKRPAALQYECAAMLAQGAKCSIGDQLHPSGEMNIDTYDLIGSAYAEVEQKEAWVSNVQPNARIAIISTELPQEPARGGSSTSISDEGAARMLLELHLPFVVLDDHASWTGFEVVIMPDGYQMHPASLAKAQAHLGRGGRILAAGSALLNDKGDEFALDPGAKLLGRSSFDPDYLLATDLTPHVPIRSAIVIENGAYEVEATFGKVLVERRVPYFNRTWEHFCSHQHTPDSPDAATPAAVISDQIAYFAHNIFSHYRRRGQPLYRDFVRAALVRLFPNGLPIETSLPSVARLNLLDQPGEMRSIVHLLYAPITLRAMSSLWGQEKPIEIIEELLPLFNTRVSVRMSKSIAKVSLAPCGTVLEFEQEEDRISFVVDEFAGHQMVVLDWIT